MAVVSVKLSPRSILRSRVIQSPMNQGRSEPPIGRWTARAPPPADVNFLLPLIEVPEALSAMLRAVDHDVTGIVPIEDRHTRSPVEFEWIGLGHALEGPAVTTRGANSTSVDAFMIARTPAGRHT